MAMNDTEDPFADVPAFTGSERATLREMIEWWDGRGPSSPSRDAVAREASPDGPAF
jgi:hypothetical protein